MPIPEDTLMAMEKAARQIKPGPWCRPYYGSKDSQDFLALIAAYREQGRELSARIDEIAALTAERDEVRVERTNEWRKRRDAEGSRDAAKAACGSLRADRASLTALLNKTRDNLTKYTRILRGPSYVEGCVGLEVDRSILDETRALLAEIEAALPPIPSATKETP